MSNNKKLMIFLKGLIIENPVLVLVLGTCPTLATTQSVISAFSMGIAATVVLVCSNTVISALRKVIPETVRIPCYIVVIAGFVTAVQMLLQAYLPSVYEMLGVYLALIVVNCIILGRAEMFARKNSVIDSAIDGLGMGLGFLLALLLMSTVREVLGKGSFAGFEIPFMQYVKIPVLAEAPGGFLVFGLLIALMNRITAKKGGVKRKSFSCEGCPSAHLCNKTSCSEMTEVVTEEENAAKAEAKAPVAPKAENKTAEAAKTEVKAEPKAEVKTEVKADGNEKTVDNATRPPVSNEEKAEDVAKTPTADKEKTDNNVDENKSEGGEKNA